jgi:murein DD-endopeptidase MepM/ murein hydrolase activator NlpD
VDDLGVVHSPKRHRRPQVGGRRNPGGMFLPLTAVGLVTFAVAAGLACVDAVPDGRARPVGPSGPAVRFDTPLPAPLRVVRPFDPPVTPYGPGHLGVDLSSRRGAIVVSAGNGVVRFAGSVAGRGVVVVLHSDGLSTEYEPVYVLVRAGQHVQLGDRLGRLAGQHPGCASACLHWGARRGDRYLDPLSLLEPLQPVRLLPWPRDG